MVANPPKTERNAEIFARWTKDNASLAQIAREFAISPARVSQIIQDAARKNAKRAATGKIPANTDKSAAAGND